MDFSKQLADLARAASSSTREGGNGNSSNSNNNDRSAGGGYNSRDSRRPYNGRNNRHHPYGGGNRRRHNHHHSHHHNHHRGQLTQAEEEFYLPKLIEAIPKFQPVAKMKKIKKRHVALLFLTIDDLPFEHLWRAFLNNYKEDPLNQSSHEDRKNDVDGNADRNRDRGTIKNGASANETTANGTSTSTSTAGETIVFESSSLLVSVICHAKFPERVRSPWLQRRLLVSNPSPRNNRNNNNRNRNNNQHNRHNNNRNYSHRGGNRNDDNAARQHVRYHTRRPEWGSIDITRAMIDLLEEGLKIGTARDRNNDEQYTTSRYISSNHESTSGNRSTLSSSLNSSIASSRSKEERPTVDRFIFVSESCLPVVTLKEFEMALFGPDDSIQQIPSRQHQHHRYRHSQKESKGSVESSDHGHHKNHQHYTGENADKSWVKAYNKPNNGYARQLQWDATKKAVPEKFIYKADQWIALTRHHAWPLISLIDEAVKSVQTNYLRNDQNNLKVALWHCFQDVKASDEIYFPTTMALLGILGAGSSNDGEESQEGIARAVATKEAEADNSIEKEIAFKRVTYCDWSENARNPASFVVNPQEDAEFKELNKKVILARDEGCLFARKFIPGGNISINSQDWVKIIHQAMTRIK
jgi:hypothetical protein